MTESKLATVFLFATEYHSGQWSRGYRLSCRSQKLIERYNAGHYQDATAWASPRRDNMLYGRLVNRYADEM